MKQSGMFENSRDAYLVVGVFIVSVMISLAVSSYEKQRNYDFGAAQFDEETTVIGNSLRTTFNDYAQVLRSGASLFQVTEEVDREIWREYIDHLQLKQNFPGIQGISYNALLHSPEEVSVFQDRIQRDDLPTYAVRPPGQQQDLYVPILYLEPSVGANRAALGFDIYSEEIRREAVDRAIATNSPSMTSKIKLIQDSENLNEDTIAGVLVILPVLEKDVDPTNGKAMQASGLIVSVFRIRDLMETILQTQALDGAAARKNVSLYEVGPKGEIKDMYLTVGEIGHDPLFQSEMTFAMFGKTWRITATSTKFFEEESRRNSHFLMLMSGILASLMLTFTVAVQAARSRESRLTAEALSKGNAQIALLLKEVNHRSKNLLSLIQAIARQTSAGNPADFSESFSRRLTSLSASQDLLVRNKWKDIEFHELVRSQLGHFHDLLGSRITIRGSDTVLDASNAQTVSMAIHELATNATKYGALSNDAGTVDIHWHCEGKAPNKKFHLYWEESGGPPVAAPSKHGFGTKVTGMMIKMSLEADIETNFATEGFSWHLSCPHHQLTIIQPESGIDPAGDRA
jgi:two-component sensor histidine kinase/CHASE1-domain containing sensor protein